MNRPENGFWIQDDLGDEFYRAWLAERDATGPHLEDGHIDWHMQDPPHPTDPPGLENLAPITMTTVTFKDRILLLKRTSNVGDAKNVWSTVNGFIDDLSLTEKQQAILELDEETGIQVDERQVIVGERYILRSPREKRPYAVTPVLARLGPDVPLNPRTHLPRVNLKKDPKKEHSKASWPIRKEVRGYKIFPDLIHHINAALVLSLDSEVMLNLPE
jgi:ADP-ribose pyrophosphatase YjhB (NUDIX family)